MAAVVNALKKKPSDLARALAHLSQKPVPVLPSVRALSLTLATRNAHFGARHFLKDGLARIAYANPDMKIDVQKKDKTREENWDPMMVIELEDGTKKEINMHGKLASVILDEVMAIGGFAGSKK